MDKIKTIEIIVFIVLVVINSINPIIAQQLKEKPMKDWIIDLSNLFIQGTLFPILQVTLFFILYRNIFPNFENSLKSPQIVSFLLNFVFVDYIYYWSHRALHSKKIWFLHKVHHNARSMDVFATSRNSIITNLFIPYIWLNSFFIYCLESPSSYIVAMTISALLDLWRHSSLLSGKSFLNRVLGTVFITPYHHGLHHSSVAFRSNYGANLTLWDKIHNTFEVEKQFNHKNMGIPLQGSFYSKLLFPWRLR